MSILTLGLLVILVVPLVVLVFRSGYDSGWNDGWLDYAEGYTHPGERPRPWWQRLLSSSEGADDFFSPLRPVDLLNATDDRGDANDQSKARRAHRLRAQPRSDGGGTAGG